MTIREINHIALHVADVEKSVAFFGEVLGLKRIARPQMNVPGAWFRIGNTQQLHLIGGRVQPVHSAIRGDHFTMEVDDIAAWEVQLRGFGVECVVWPRPDDATSIFLKDPDGHVVELLARATQASEEDGEMTGLPAGT
jgi:catechol 2,3-dioxygenase-like lactoylglutathione lyase family enzyme